MGGGVRLAPAGLCMFGVSFTIGEYCEIDEAPL